MIRVFKLFSLIALSVLVILTMPASASDRVAQSIYSGLNSTNLSAAAEQLRSPAGPGSYDVGRTTLSYIDTARGDRPIVIDVWYPIRGQSDLVFSSYDLVFTQLPSTVARADATVAAGQHPLIVFSHGSQGIRFQSFFLAEALASHGFIVASPDHAGNTAADLVFDTVAPFEQVVIDRPLDLRFVIDQMLANQDDPDSLFFDHIDAARIGAMGHSFGGYTTLALAGGVDGVVAADPRLKAIAPLAPASGLLSDEQLSGVLPPALIVGGTQDSTTPIDDNSTRPFELMVESMRQQVDLIDAGHQSFTNICIFSDTLLDAGIPDTLIGFLLGNADEGCAPNLLPIDRAHELTQLYVVAFFHRFLNSDLRYQMFLNPEFAAAKLLPVAVQQAGF